MLASHWTARLVAAAMVLSASGVVALTPFPKPQPAVGIDPALAEPFVGSWSVTLPTMEVGVADTVLAACTLPVRIEEANENHIFYLGPRDVEADAALELVPHDIGARWAPIAGGPGYFAVWVEPDRFYLYDILPETEADWGRPFIYQRCD